MELLSFAGMEKAYLLGGGKFFAEFALWTQSNIGPTKIITSPRQEAEIIGNGLTLGQFLEKHGLDFLIVESMSDDRLGQFMKDINDTTLCLSIGAAWIFDRLTLNRFFKNRLLNLHGTRLPQNRGGASVSWQIMMGNRFGFCQVHLVDEGIDTGPLVLTHEFVYPAACRTPQDYDDHYRQELFQFLAREFSNAALNGIQWKLTRQAEYLSSYWPRLVTAENGWIDWNNSSEEVERFICAFDRPYSGALTKWNGQPVHIRTVSLDHSDGSFHPFQNGIIFRKGPSWVCVALRSATLIVQEVTNSDGDSVFAKLSVGDRFYTDGDKLSTRLLRKYIRPN